MIEQMIDVWKVSDGSTSFYCDNEQQAKDCAESDAKEGVENLSIIRERMSKKAFRSLPEFDGF